MAVQTINVDSPKKEEWGIKSCSIFIAFEMNAISMYHLKTKFWFLWKDVDLLSVTLKLIFTKQHLISIASKRITCSIYCNNKHFFSLVVNIYIHFNF